MKGYNPEGKKIIVRELHVLSHTAGNYLTEMKGNIEERCQYTSQWCNKEKILSLYSDFNLRPSDFNVNYVTDY